MNQIIDSDQRRLAVDPAESETAALPIDGERLKREREQRGMSPADAARIATLSREQIIQIEQGGSGAFYGPRHKLLAARKYADALGLHRGELLAVDTIPETRPLSPEVLPVLAGSAPDTARRQIPVTQLSSAASSRLLTALALVCTLALLFSIARGLVPAAAPPAPSAALEIVEPPVAAPAPVAHDTSSTRAGAGSQDACSLQRTDESVASWAPTLARRTDTRLFLASAAEAEVCVTDATGAQRLLRLKPGATGSVAGKPPYLLRSAQLARMQIYLQGLKVRVPSSAVALRLFAAELAPVQQAPAPSGPAS